MKYKAIIFDCDGTLLNTISDLTNAVNYALNEIGCKKQTDADTLRMVGNGIKALVKRALPETHGNRFDEAFGLFKSYYGEHFADYTEPYDGIIDLLVKLKERGYKVALVSNKNRVYLKMLFDKFFADTIDYWIGETEGLAPKPASDMVYRALENLNVSRNESVYVGDSSVDVATANNSGMDGIFVTWGFASKEDLIKCGATKIIDAPQELLDLI